MSTGTGTKFKIDSSGFIQLQNPKATGKEECGSTVGAVGAGFIGEVIGGLAALRLCCGTFDAITALAFGP